MRSETPVDPCPLQQVLIEMSDEKTDVLQGTLDEAKLDREAQQWRRYALAVELILQFN